MSYDIDDDGNKFYTEDGLKDEENKEKPLNFDDWLDINTDDLVDEWIKKTPEDYPTRESCMKVEEEGLFQEWTEQRHNEYLEEFE